MSGHVVVAPDKFKGSLGAAGVASAVASGLRAAVPGLDAREHPVADGGDGTVEAALLSAGIAQAYTLSDLEDDLGRSMREPVPLLRRLAGLIAADWLGGEA